MPQSSMMAIYKMQTGAVKYARELEEKLHRVAAASAELRRFPDGPKWVVWATDVNGQGGYARHRSAYIELKR